MKEVLGGKIWYQATNDNMTMVCSPASAGGCAASCYVTCTQQTSTDNGATWQNTGTGACANGAVCDY